MYDFVMAKDGELMDIILNGPCVSIREVKKKEVTRLVPKTRRKYDEDDHNKIEKNYKENKWFVCHRT